MLSELIHWLSLRRGHNWNLNALKTNLIIAWESRANTILDQWKIN